MLRSALLTPGATRVMRASGALSAPHLYNIRVTSARDAHNIRTQHSRGIRVTFAQHLQNIRTTYA
jgi:hypothetical protein